MLFFHNKEGLNRIKAVIKSQGRNEKWVAEQLGISPTSLSNYCTFLREPPLDLLFKLAALLEVPVTDLINLDAKIPPESLKKKPGKGKDSEKTDGE